MGGFVSFIFWIAIFIMIAVSATKKKNSGGEDESRKMVAREYNKDLDRFNKAYEKVREAGKNAATTAEIAMMTIMSDGGTEVRSGRVNRSQPMLKNVQTSGGSSKAYSNAQSRAVASGRKDTNGRGISAEAPAADQNQKFDAEAAKAAIRARAKANASTSIVDRAKANTNKLQGDETLKEIEASHHHSENDPHIEEEHSGTCRTLKANPEEEAPESLLPGTQDLIVEGYSGKLPFERDFLGEAMDMINEFTLAGGSSHK